MLKKLVCYLVAFSLVLLPACSAKPKTQDTEKTTAQAADDSIKKPDTTKPDNSNQNESSQNAPAETPEKIIASAEFFTDQAGREVKKPKKLERIVSCIYPATSVLLALGVGKKLVGIEANAMSRELYNMTAPYLLDLPYVGDYNFFNLEDCLKLKPDLVILPKNLLSSVEFLTKEGVTVFVVAPESYDKMAEMIGLFGDMFGGEVAKKANSLLKLYDEKQTLLASIAKVPLNKKIYFMGEKSPLYTAFEPSYFDDIAKFSGTSSCNSLVGAVKGETSYYELLKLNPDYIIISANAKYTKKDVLEDPKLKGINAVKNNKVFVMPSPLEALDYPCAALPFAPLYLASIFYPKAYTSDACANELSAFYKTYYNADIDPDDLILK